MRVFGGSEGKDGKARISWINNLASQELKFKIL